MALRKKMPKTNGVIPQKAEKKSTDKTGDLIIVTGSRGSCSESLGCNKVANCIATDPLTGLAVTNIINTQLGLPSGGQLTNFCPAVVACLSQEIIQDLIGDTIEGYDYNDVLNGWLMENPFPVAHTFTSAANTMSSSVGGNPVLNATIINSNDLSNVGLVITSTVNGVADSIDITAAVQAELSGATDSVTNTILPGHQIATHTAVDGTIVDIYETITSLTYYELGTDSGLEYEDEDGTTNTIKLGHYETISPTINVPETITHNLNSVRIVVVAYDTVSGEQVDVEVVNRTLNSVDIISTTNDDLDIVIKK